MNLKILVGVIIVFCIVGVSTASASVAPEVSAGDTYTVGLKSDGTVVATGWNGSGQCNVGEWNDIIQVSAGDSHTVGLKSDGTGVATGWNKYGCSNVGEWNDIIQVSAGWAHTVGLKSDGTGVATGWNGYGQCNVGEWNDIIQVSAGSTHTVGLKSDGTGVATGWNGYGQCNVGGWSDIVQVSAGYMHTVGLKSDGTVVATGFNAFGVCNVDGWSDIVQVSTTGFGHGHTVGLKSDGTGVATGWNDYGQCNVDGWSDIVQVSAGWAHTVGLKSDGSVMATGLHSCGECDVSGWELDVTEQDLTFSPESWEFGSVTEGSQPQQTFKITNEGNADLVISDITSSCSYISISDISLQATITPDSSETFIATVDTTGLSGSIVEIITINSNDPDEGTVDIGVCGDVGLPDPPDPVYDFHAYPYDEKVSLYWNNPSSALFKGTKIIYKTDGYPSTPLDGNLVCDREKNPSSPDNCFFENVDYNTPYYFTAFSYDHYGQYSNGATLLLRYIPGIPPYDEEDFDGSNLCAPVASARILGYWDDRGYDKLVDGSSSSLDDVKTLVNNLKKAQRWTSWLGTPVYFAGTGLALVCNYPPYGNNYCFDVRLYDSVSWEFLKSEIDAGRPLLYWSKGEPYLEEHITHVSGYTEIGLIGGGVDERRFIDALEGSDGDQFWKEDLPDKLITIIPASCAGGLKIFGLSPIDLIVSDPEGLIINNQIDEIPGALYAEDDINGDSDPDDLIIIPDRKIGDYIITVTQESGASLTDTYTLEVSAGDTTIVLAEDIPISDIPDQPYVIESTEEGIEDKTPSTEPIPEFTTIAIPVAAIIGLVFLLRRRRHKK